MMLNHKEDQALALVQKRAMDSSDSEAEDGEEKRDAVELYAYSKMSLQDQAVEDANKLEREMNKMFRELDDM